MPFGRRSIPKSPRRKPPPAAEYNALAVRYNRLNAAYTALVAGLPERDRQVRDAAVADALATATRAARLAMPKRDARTTERIVDELAQAGLLRLKPAKPTNVRRILRDDAGLAIGLEDVITQVEDEGPMADA